LPKRVLVVDDNKDQVDTLTALLGLRGYETQGHYDTLTILACIRDFDPDVAILDLAMPVKSGWDAAREIRATIPGKRPKLIALTAEQRLPAELRRDPTVFDDYLVKPCDPDVLVDLIEST
jgi:DNA-binding response OmpR family regulator